MGNLSETSPVFFAKKDSSPFAETKNPNDFLIKKKERL